MTYVLLGLGEALMLSLFVMVAMLLYVRKLKALLAKTKKPSASEPQTEDTEVAAQEPTLTYCDYIDLHIRELHRYHKSLKGGQDIALDLDPAAPVERRMASMRHIMLVAEREATHTSETNWPELVTRYRQLMRFFEDTPSPKLESEVAALQQNLQVSHAKVTELTKYKALYFDLEKNWHASNAQANNQFDQLKATISAEQGSDELVSLLESYRSSFNPIAAMFESGQSLPVRL